MNDKKFREKIETLLKVTEVQLKLEGYSQNDINEIILHSSLILLDFLMTNAPMHESNFHRAVEVALTFLKSIKDEHPN